MTVSIRYYTELRDGKPWVMAEVGGKLYAMCSRPTMPQATATAHRMQNASDAVLLRQIAKRKA